MENKVPVTHIVLDFLHGDTQLSKKKKTAIDRLKKYVST